MKNLIIYSSFILCLFFSPFVFANETEENVPSQVRPHEKINGNAKNVRMEFKGEQIERSRFSSSIETIQLSKTSSSQDSGKPKSRLHSTKGDFKKEIKDSLHTLKEAAW